MESLLQRLAENRSQGIQGFPASSKNKEVSDAKKNKEFITADEFAKRLSAVDLVKVRHLAESIHKR